MSSSPAVGRGRESLDVRLTAPRLSADRLTIGRLLLMTAGIAAGLALFLDPTTLSLDNGEHVRMIFNAPLLGASLPGAWFVLSDRRARRRMGIGGWMALSTSLGVILLAPAAAMVRFGGRGPALGCIHYMIPLGMLYLLLSGVVTGRIRRRSFGRRATFADRYGLWLGTLFAPIALSILWEIYSEAFF